MREREVRFCRSTKKETRERPAWQLQHNIIMASCKKASSISSHVISRLLFPPPSPSVEV